MCCQWYELAITSNWNSMLRIPTWAKIFTHKPKQTMLIYMDFNVDFSYWLINASACEHAGWAWWYLCKGSMSCAKRSQKPGPCLQGHAMLSAISSNIGFLWILSLIQQISCRQSRRLICHNCMFTHMLLILGGSNASTYMYLPCVRLLICS